MHKLRFALTVAALACARSSYAADASGSSAIYGAGGLKCAAVIQDPAFADKSSGAHQALLSWFEGYLSAANAYRPGIFDLSPIMSPDDLYGILYNKCRAAPNSAVQLAAAGTIDALAIAKSFQFTPVVEFKNDYGTMVIRQGVVMQIQNALTKRGVFKGYLDGKPTPALQAAIKTFQTQRKLHETGLPDADTIIALLITPAFDTMEKNRR